MFFNTFIKVFSQALKPVHLIKTDGYKTLSPLNIGFLLLPSNSKLLDSSIYDNTFEQVRHGRQFKRIRGPPRPPLPFKEVPRPHFYEYRPIYPKDEEYTTKSLPIQKLGGRSPTTGKVVCKLIGGGNKKRFRWVDYKHGAPENETIEEKVFNVRYDPLHSNLIALVARNGVKRWIVASENMKPGDIIKTTNIIPRNPIEASEGQILPIGALIPGTLVHNVEKHPGEGGHFARAAGTSCIIERRIGSKVVVKVPSGRLYALDEHCFAAVGKVSNPLHYTINRLCPQRSRWLGKRPRSGCHHKKDGYCGKKLRPPKPLEFIDAIKKIKSQQIIQTLTFD